MIYGNIIRRNMNRFASVRVLELAAFLGIGLAATTPFPAFAGTSGTWANTGSLNTARYLHTATLLQNGQVLVAGGLNPSENPLASAELYNPATGAWTFTGSMAEARSGHTATLLQNGEVLVAEGLGETDSCLAAAELYNPSTGHWATIGTMTEGRCSHTATLLPSGEVLVAGGNDSTGVLLSAELFNPATGTWKATGPLNVARYGAAAVLLQSGEALVASGKSSTGSALASTEIYNPSQGQWALASNLNSTSLATTTATLLSNSDVLVGVSGQYADPSVLTWTDTGGFPNLALVGGGHAQTLLDTGNVLVTGTRCNYSGCSHVATFFCFLYDPSTNLWSSTGSMHYARVYHTTTLLPDGQVLAAGGQAANLTVLGTAELDTP
jgi:hypothetical protein